MSRLEKYGASARFFAEATLFPGLFPARVVSQYKDLYRVVTERGEGLAEVSGRFRHEAMHLSDYPAVGDFVMLDRETMQAGNAMIQAVLSRKSAFERSAVGYTDQAQVVAANIDVVFLCMALNNDYNLSRLERYISVAWNSGASPVVVLTKSDLRGNLAELLEEVSLVAIGVDVIATSSFDQESVGEIMGYLRPGVSASFIGSSGVGKSTLVNMLAGNEVLRTSETRRDDKGRHTTTRRELMVLPQGGIVIDTPGMRELGLESADLSRSFADIDDFISECRFNDCTHAAEPGCAVLKAIASGQLDQRRFDNYLKLQKESRYNGLSARQIEEEKLNSMFGGVSGINQFRNSLKRKDKYK